MIWGLRQMDSREAMLPLRRAALTAGLCLYACSRIFVQDLGGAAQREAQARLDVVVAIGSEPAPNATVIAAEEGLQHVAAGRTDSGGRALLVVPAGRYRISASLAGHTDVSSLAESGTPSNGYSN